MKYIKTNWNIPYYNMAFEYYLINNPKFDEDYVFFYIHKPSIIVGKNQNTAEEINAKFVKDNNIYVSRRNTGGGAVYHDEGNLNFSFVFRQRDEDNKIDFKKYTFPVIKALKKLGAEATLSGRNDILIDGKKVSGNAQLVKKGKVLTHGTLMFDVNVENMVDSLNVSQLKIESKAIKSVRSRVTNIKEYISDKEMDIYSFKEALLNSFFEGEDMEEYVLTEEDYREIEKLVKEKFETWEHNYGNSPKFSNCVKKKFDAGVIEARFDVEKGIIKDIKINGDYFFVKDTHEFEDLLRGCEYREEAILNRLNGINLNEYIDNLKAENVIDLLIY